MKINIKGFYKIVVSLLLVIARPAHINQNNKFANLCKSVKKEGRDEVHFFAQMSIIVFYKLLLSFLIGVVRHVQKTQKNKYAVSLQYLKKELSYEVDVLHVDRHEILLQVDTNIFVTS